MIILLEIVDCNSFKNQVFLYFATSKKEEVRGYQFGGLYVLTPITPQWLGRCR